ncbi:MAG: hypothetical protein QOF51_374, partial [Chloroflexota bacterium]|nr:hypothetical protein [Chloroflexota bacterium]
MASLQFERGDPDRPVGHAFVYFTGAGDEVGATYVLVPPVALDFAKYVPPLLASTLGASGLLAQTTFMPVPPAPEQMSLSEVRRLAELRGDDILLGGSMGAYDLPGLMGQVAEVGEAYAQMYHAALEQAPAAISPRAEASTSASDLDTRALLYSTLPERERLDDLARQLVTLRYAVEAGDSALLQATETEMRAIAAYMPKKYWLDELIQVAGRRDTAAPRLAQLYFERGYKLTS